ncbi:MAG: MBL fold metallo-hydrolase [Desulfitobacteriia bacterium]|jgi:7,8-dihydropterin-6-yl-methyl-4-(beta-D-ribofuranosyl)aminobenzene 5'-phosphate synthase
MQVTTLLENTKVEKANLINKHGLSLYIKTGGQKILFDTGPDDSLLHNAAELGIDLAEVNILVISHIHRDHGGGLGVFLKNNSKAKVYLNTNTQREYYVQRSATEFEYIGLDQAVLKTYHDRLNYVWEKTSIAPGITLLRNTEYSGFRAKTINIRLEDGSIGQDSFDHELIMVLEEQGVLHVFTGCSHNGITNMVESVKKEFPGQKIQSLTGGFHLMNPHTGVIAEDEDTVKGLARKLLEQDIPYIYTGHCTGPEAFKIMQGILRERLGGLSTGKRITVPQR